MSQAQRISSLLALAAALACGPEASVPPLEVDTEAKLAAHSQEFRRELIEVTDGVYVAVGFGLANSILIEGDDGVIVVDTLESLEAARDVKARFDEVTAKPVVAIVYTHNHTDHIFGARAFAGEGDETPPVYAHETTNAYIDRVVNVIRPAIYTRSMRMFGNYLPEGGVVNAGIGPALRTGHGGGTLGLIRPDHTFADRLELELAGVKLELVHAPGETNDQIFVWLPEKRVLMPGDNFYRSFPNLYTIRGTLYRDVTQWVRSLDAMRALRPEYLVPSHTRPISGEAEVYRALTDYRDAIQFVHDQTIRGINRGLTTDEIVEEVKLPPHLAESPYLQEFYGTVEWSVRSIFTGYLGWFDGNAATLSPVGPDERARRMAELAGGQASLVDAARAALDAGDHAWAAELADLAARLETTRAEALAIKADALQALGEAHRSANGRHYYLTQALEARGDVAIDFADQPEPPLDLVHSFPVSGIMAALGVNLDPEKSAEVDQVVGFRFPDVGESYTIHVRRGVAEVQPVYPENPDLEIEVDSNVWKEILAGIRSPAVALASGDVQSESTLELVRFLNLFRS